MWQRHLIFTLVVWVLLAVILEGGLRLAGFAPSLPMELAPQYEKFVPDDELIWALKPDWQGFELDETPLAHNSVGFRGREPRGDRDPADLRIMFLGDSVTYGHHLKEDETLVVQLQRQLQARTGGSVEVINTGVPGYSTFQSAGQLRRFGEQLAPDMVLLGFCLNDVTERYTKLAAYGGSRIFMLNVDTARGLAWPNRVWLASAIRQAFVGLIRGAASRGQDYRLRALWEEPDSSPIAEAWKTVFREIDDIRAEATRLGVPLGILIYPLAVQVEISSGYEAPQQVLATHLAGQGIPYLDLLAPLRDSPLPMRQLFLDITHFSPSGTVEVARIAASFVYETYLAER